MNMDDIERSNVRLISSICFSFRQRDLLDLRGLCAFDYAAFSGSGKAVFSRAIKCEAEFCVQILWLDLRTFVHLFCVNIC